MVTIDNRWFVHLHWFVSSPLVQIVVFGYLRLCYNLLAHVTLIIVLFVNVCSRSLVFPVPQRLLRRQEQRREHRVHMLSSSFFLSLYVTVCHHKCEDVIAGWAPWRWSAIISTLKDMSTAHQIVYKENRYEQKILGELLEMCFDLSQHRTIPAESHTPGAK